jgi:hypothetical protein
MELPDDVLQIIKEFSQPITRPDLRKLHIMSFDNFYKNLYSYHIVRYKVDGGVMHLICIRNIHMKVFVHHEKKEMSIIPIERAVWP